MTKNVDTFDDFVNESADDRSLEENEKTIHDFLKKTEDLGFHLRLKSTSVQLKHCTGCFEVESIDKNVIVDTLKKMNLNEECFVNDSDYDDVISGNWFFLKSKTMIFFRNGSLLNKAKRLYIFHFESYDLDDAIKAFLDLYENCLYLFIKSIFTFSKMNISNKWKNDTSFDYSSKCALEFKDDFDYFKKMKDVSPEFENMVIPFLMASEMLKMRMGSDSVKIFFDPGEVNFLFFENKSKSVRTLHFMFFRSFRKYKDKYENIINFKRIVMCSSNHQKIKTLNSFDDLEDAINATNDANDSHGNRMMRMFYENFEKILNSKGNEMKIFDEYFDENKGRYYGNKYGI